jgi:hypothetical protein
MFLTAQHNAREATVAINISPWHSQKPLVTLDIPRPVLIFHPLLALAGGTIF